MSSIYSFPERGPWGKSSWRGNCSGHVYQQLFKQLQPKVFTDPMMGSGTSIEVAKEMSIEAYGLDLSRGFNAVRHSILNAVGKESDLCLSHPPYHSMIIYSGEVWGTEPHPDDLSRCRDEEEFHCKMQLVLLNQRDATAAGGYYGTIIGDLRKDGRYTSFQAEMIARMPSEELAAVLIKAQHNVQSERKSYGRMSLPWIMHEYILLWKKKPLPVLALLGRLANQQYARLQGTWKSIVKSVLISLGGEADLATLYAAVSKAAPEKLAQTNTWKEKIRQTLQMSPDAFYSSQRGVWSIAA